MENSEVPENSEQIPDNSENKEQKKEEPDKKEEAEAEQKTPVAAKAKSRGRPKNSKDTKPRIKRIPIAPPEEEVPKTKPQKAKKVIVQEEQEEEEEEHEPEEVAPPPPTPEPVPKSPRSLRREHMQSVAAQKRAMTQARQDRFERVLDGFMGF